MWKALKQEGRRYSLSFASFLVFLINAENLANTSFPAELDSGCWGPSLGYLEKFKFGVSQTMVGGSNMSFSEWI